MLHRNVNDAQFFVDKNRRQWIFIHVGPWTKFQSIRWCANYMYVK